MPGAEGNLLGFGEEVVRVAVQHHLAQRRDGHQFFGDQLGRVENVEIEGVFIFFFDDLHPQLPFRVVADLNRLPQITPMVVGVLSRKLLRFVPHQGASAGRRAPVEFDEARLALGIDQAKGVHAEALHAAQAFRDRPVGHCPHHHVRRLRHQRNEVPEGVVGRATGRDLVMRLGFDRVHEVGKLDRILYEKHRHVIAHQVEVAFVGEELHGETPYITHGIA
ncbi:hypothetical protein D3C71_1425230 [compost metagenome]